MHLHRLPQGDGAAGRPRRPGAQPQCAGPLRDRLRAVHVLRYLHRGLPLRRALLVTGVRVRRDGHPRADARARQAPRVDVDGARTAGARPGGRGAQGTRRRPQGGGQARRPAAGRSRSGPGPGRRRQTRKQRTRTDRTPQGRERDARRHRSRPWLPVDLRCRDRLRPRRYRHPRRGRHHRHHPADGARRPLAGRRPRRDRRRIPPAHGGVHRLGAGADLRRVRRRPAALRADAHQGAHRPLPGRRFGQPLGRAGRGPRLGRRPGLGRRGRVPRHLDQPRRARPGLHRGLRAQPLPVLGAALRGAVRAAAGRARRRDRAVPQVGGGRAAAADLKNGSFRTPAAPAPREEQR